MSTTGSEKASTSANSRSHTQGRHDREYTSAQMAAVNRVRKCRVTDYYSILDIEKPSSEGEVRKAYRKLALIMHPDKNSAPGADEAFKMISKAFQILSDADKKRIYDQTGSDPDSRSMPSFSRGGGGGGGGAGTQAFQGDVSPEELFNMFFGGGGGNFGQFGGFGGPNIRVHTFGGGGSPFGFGGVPRQRAGQRAGQQEEEEVFSFKNLLQVLPLLLLFGLPGLFSLISGGGSSSPAASYRYAEAAPFTQERFTPQHNIKYYVNPREVSGLTDRKLSQLDSQAEVNYVRQMRDRCSNEYEYKQQKIQESKGWFFVDEQKLAQAERIPLTSCDILDDLGIAFNRYS